MSITIEQMIEREVLGDVSEWVCGIARDHSDAARAKHAMRFIAAQLDDSIFVVRDHWAVSPWLAERLLAHNELVDLDFEGKIVWARVNSAKTLPQEEVLQRIHAELVADNV